MSFTHITGTNIESIDCFVFRSVYTVKANQSDLRLD